MSKFTTISDASLLSVLQTQLEAINVRVMQDPLPDIQYPNLIPVDTNFGEWQPSATSITFDNGVGVAKWINTYSKDVPKVEVGARESQYSFAEFALGWSTNVGEVGMAAGVGFNIPDTKARIVRRKAEEFIDSVALTGVTPDGDDSKGYTGLINKTGITPITASTKAAGGTVWVNLDGSLNATAAEIAADIVNLVLGPVQLTNTVRPLSANTIALPSLAFRALAGTFTDALNGQISYLEWVQRQIAGVPGGADIAIVEIPELATAGSDGGGRAIAYRRSADVLTLPMPFAFRFLNEWKDSPFGYSIPGIGRFGELQIHEPRAFRYLDGITPVPA